MQKRNPLKITATPENKQAEVTATTDRLKPVKIG